MQLAQFILFNLLCSVKLCFFFHKFTFVSMTPDDKNRRTPWTRLQQPLLLNAPEAIPEQALSCSLEGLEL